MMAVSKILKLFLLRTITLLVVVVISASSIHAAAPWFVIFHGGSLKTSKTLSDWHENQRLMLAIRDKAADAALQNRPYIEIAFFWGPDFAPNRRNASAPLGIEDANQRGRFYPMHNGADPVVMLGQSDKRSITSEGLAILEKYGIAVR
jgi:hypothetical protein